MSTKRINTEDKKQKKSRKRGKLNMRKMKKVRSVLVDAPGGLEKNQDWKKTESNKMVLPTYNKLALENNTILDEESLSDSVPLE